MMDGAKFDALAKGLATGRTRRSVLKGLIGGGAAIVGAKAADVGAQRQQKIVLCHATSSVTNPWVMINVAKASEVPAHMSHGDFPLTENVACCRDQDCRKPDNPCEEAYCTVISADPENPSAECGVRNKPDNTACEDGNLCTEFDVCLKGACVPGRKIRCFADQCNDGICNPDTGRCETSPRENGTECDDGDLCTQEDVCAEGVCAGSPKCGPGQICDAGECVSPKTCEPGTYIDGDFCVLCGPGTYSSEPDSISCSLCPPGRFADSEGSDSCTECAIGTAQASSGAAQCVKCAPGTYAANPGLDVCASCKCGPDCDAGSGICPDPTTTTTTAPDICSEAGSVCGDVVYCGCGFCVKRLEGGIGCGNNTKPSSIPCNECTINSDCENLYPGVAGVFCGDPGPACNCGSTPGQCFTPCTP